MKTRGDDGGEGHTGTRKNERTRGSSSWFFYRVNSVLVLFDVESRASFAACEEQRMKVPHGAQEPAYAVCGVASAWGYRCASVPVRREVSEEEARAWCAARGLPYFEVDLWVDDTRADTVVDTLVRNVAGFFPAPPNMNDNSNR